MLEKKNLYMMVLAFTLSAGSILLLMKLSGFEGVKDALKIHPVYIVVILVIVILSLIVDTLRIKSLLDALGENLPFNYLFKFNLATFFISYITPFGSGVLPLTIYLLNKKNVSPNKSLMVFTAKLLFSGIFFGTVPPILLIFFRNQLELGPVLSYFAILVSIVLIVLLLILVYIILRPRFVIGIVDKIADISFFKKPKFEKYFVRTKEEIVFYHKNFNDLFMVPSSYKLFFSQLFYAIAFWTLFYSIAPILLVAINIHFNLLSVIARQLIFYDILAYSFIPSGSGVVEIGFATIFSNILPRSLLGVFVGIWRFFTYYVYLMISAVGFFLVVKKNENVN
ncbi:lysylphosphatidylglycerol synthase transmembranedomain-containing protein [Thermoanaerobacter kivui]|nr:lysylphosphatidylglycerol synthase transmembrane domain-containing protein [Thermoanaerobacter kivui]